MKGPKQVPKTSVLVPPAKPKLSSKGVNDVKSFSRIMNFEMQASVQNIPTIFKELGGPVKDK
jgi:hypothetical protein